MKKGSIEEQGIKSFLSRGRGRKLRGRRKISVGEKGFLKF